MIEVRLIYLAPFWRTDFSPASLFDELVLVQRPFLRNWLQSFLAILILVQRLSIKITTSFFTVVEL